MKFHILAGVLLVGIIGLIYLLLAGFQSDLSNARQTIEKESFQAARKKREANKELTFINKDLPMESAAAPEKAVAPKQETQAKEATRPEASPEITDRIEGQEYWCRPTTVRKDKNPVRCEYQDACFSCKNSQVIPPEVESAVPFCKDGSRAEVYTVECCPATVSGTDFQCPDINECMHAENVPQDFCACNGRPNCKYVLIGENIQCACMDN